jgi:multiple sugar transport system permease protein
MHDSAPSRQLERTTATSARPTARGSRPTWPGARSALLPYALIFPLLLLLALVMLYPLLYEIDLSVRQEVLYIPQTPFVGWDNFRHILGDSQFWSSIRLTLIWTVGCLVFQFALGMALALTFARGVPGSRFFRTLFLAPWVMPGVVVAIIWQWMYQPIFGILNTALTDVGLPAQQWLTDPSIVLPAVIVVNIWKGFPFWMIMLTAGLQTVPRDLYEAATVDGAGRVAQFRYVTVPCLKTVLVITTILAFVWTFNYLDVVYVLTNGGPANLTQIFPVYIYQTAFQGQQLGLAAAASMILFVAMTLVMILYLRVSRVREV